MAVTSPLPEALERAAAGVASPDFFRVFSPHTAARLAARRLENLQFLPKKEEEVVFASWKEKTKHLEKE